MNRGVWAAVRCAAVNDVISSSALRNLGVASGTITNRCRDGGTWQRILPGIILLHNGFPSTLQRNTAALLYGGDEAVLSGHASLGVQGYRSSSSMSDVLILLPPHRHRAPTSYVAVERTWRMPEPARRGSLVCAPIGRSVIDAARRTSDEGRCRALLADVVQRGDVSVEELALELAAGSRRSSAVPRRVLAELTNDAHSVAEVHAQKLYARTGLPEMVHNRDVLAASGEFLARPDGWIDDVAMAWEIDSLAHHLSPADHEATMLRRARMRRHGIVVVEHLPKVLIANPEVVEADLWANYRLACDRPRPDVWLAA